MVEGGGTYRPSNGTEGDIFMSYWCENCLLFNFEEPDKACDINLRAMAHSIGENAYPAEWQYNNGGEPVCTAFAEDEPHELRCPNTSDMFYEE
ncbi:hypothetical protein [Lentilitoribacter sp. EG35]|uniref:hypothetical protein n=1 Tax=Lentilitoribacter sp. EG35 TaxID=3234192 RepID=UPI0034613E35